MTTKVRFIVKSAVQQEAVSKGKRVSAGYYAYLDRKVKSIMERDMHTLGSRKTLNVEDAEARERFAVKPR